MNQECSCQTVENLLAQEGLEGLTRDPAAQDHVQHCLGCASLCDELRAVQEFERAQPGPSAALSERALAAVLSQQSQYRRHPLRELLGKLGGKFAQEVQTVRGSGYYRSLRAPLLIAAFLGLALILLTPTLGGLGYAMQQLLVPLLLILCCALSVFSLLLKDPRRAAGFAVICLLVVLVPKQGRYDRFDMGESSTYPSALTEESYQDRVSADQNRPMAPATPRSEERQRSYDEVAVLKGKAAEDRDSRVAQRRSAGKDSSASALERAQVLPKEQLANAPAVGYGQAAPQRNKAEQKLLAGRINRPGAYQLESNLGVYPQGQAASRQNELLAPLKKSAGGKAGAAGELSEVDSAKQDQKERIKLLSGVRGPSDGTEYPTVSDDEKGSEGDKAARETLSAFDKSPRARSHVVTVQALDELMPGILAATPQSQQSLNNSLSNARAQVEQLPTERLQFQDPRGYWANNYIPGDPAYQLLANRLARSSRQELLATNGQSLLLEQLSERVPQPFDAPDFSSLAIYLTSDQTQIQGKTRALLQVGIKASERKRGSRPTMNIALVLDLPANALDAQMLETISSLLRSLEKERQIGDRFSLVVAGRPGGALISPAEFRYGTVRVAIDCLRQPEQGAELLTSTQALAKGVRFARQGDDANAPLGSSVVLFASLRDISPNLAALRLLAHDSAVSGVPVSVITLGSAVPQEPLDELVLAGQGSRRFVTSPEEAQQAVQHELESLTMVVARALRIRIRLNPKVKLIRVLGSQRLDENRAQEQRQAEQSIDQRMARSIGISADRGEDEDGIQIIIPAFYAGDAHAILLDVLVNEPGELADVQLRFKDLVNLKNSVSRAMLTLPAYDQRPLGALERNVTRNYLAYQLFDGLQQTATSVENSDFPQARASVEGLRQNLAQYQPIFAQDQSLAQDLRMLEEFSTVLAQARGQEQQEFISDALNYAAQRKILQQAIK